MMSQWQETMNGIFAHFAIPIQLQHEASSVHVFGGTWESVLEQMHSRQDSIVARLEKDGVGAISRREALFMYASQWVEWMLVRGHEHPDHEKMVELMEQWLIVYRTMGEKFRS